jgi:hypothetical protein
MLDAALEAASAHSCLFAALCCTMDPSTAHHLTKGDLAELVVHDPQLIGMRGKVPVETAVEQKGGHQCLVHAEQGREQQDGGSGRTHQNSTNCRKDDENQTFVVCFVVAHRPWAEGASQGADGEI